MRTIKFKLTQEQGKYGVETRCTHIQIREDDKFTGFEKHDPELIEWINDQEFIIQQSDNKSQEEIVDSRQQAIKI